MFRIGINVGLRVSDIISLKVGSIRAKAHVTIIEKKTGKTKRFLIPNSLQKEIAEFIKTNNLEDEDFGYLSPPGGVGVREASDGEIYMEYASVHYFLTEFMDAKIRYNPLTDTIRIKDK